MKTVISVVVLFLIFFSFMPLNAQWAKIYGGEGSESGSSIQQTVDGGYIVAGSASSFGAGGYDFWVLKLSSGGDIEWQKTYGGTADDSAMSIQQTIDEGYIVAGWTSSFGAGGGWFGEIWVLKLSSAGDVEWQKTYGGMKQDSASSIQQTVDGGYIVAGWTSSFGVGADDFWVLKLSSTGDIEWQKTYGGIEGDSATSIQQTIDGGYIVTGDYMPFGAKDYDFWILKLSSEGNIEWQKNYGSGGADSIQQTIDGGYIVAGWTDSFGAGGYDFWVLKLSSGGDIEWQKTYGGNRDDSARSIQLTVDGGYIVAGSAASFGVWDSELWVLKLSSAGDIEWQKSYGGNYSSDGASSIQQANDEGYIVAGDTSSWGDRDGIWVLKLLQNGDIDPGCVFIRDSNGVVSDSNIIPVNLDKVPEDTNISAQDTDVSPQDSDADVYALCISDVCDLTLVARGPGTTSPPPGTRTYDAGTMVTIEAKPYKGCGFSGWYGNVIYDINPVTITMDGDKKITADFYELGQGGGDAFDALTCFIATSAYGSPLHPHVEILRDFRDKYLKSNKLGRELVDLYYKYSPYVANIITKHKPLRIIAQINLIPFVVFSYSMVHLGPIVTGVIFIFVFMLLFFPVVSYRRKLA